MSALVRILPEITALKHRARALAMLDAILGPDRSYRTFFFDPVWSADEQMAKQDDGSGNDCYLVFSPVGCFVRGFDHESEMTPWAHDPPQVWPGLLRSVPEVFASMVNEPAFGSATSITFCLWRQAADDRWHADEIRYPDDDETADGSKDLLAPYIEGAQWYVTFASEYFEVEVPHAAVQAIYAGEALTGEIIRSLAPQADIAAAMNDAVEIGYPVSNG